MRPINALVDITNYVMLATGQPTHAFDSDHIDGHIIVRRADGGRKLLLLNGKDLPSADDLVIADDAGVVALAGVMGGAKDSILPHHPQGDSGGSQLPGRRRPPDGSAVRQPHRGLPPAMKRPSTPALRSGAGAGGVALFRQLYPEVQFTGLVDHYPPPWPATGGLTWPSAGWSAVSASL